MPKGTTVGRGRRVSKPKPPAPPKKGTTKLKKPSDVVITPTEERAARADVPGQLNIQTPFGGPTIQTPVITTQRRFQELRDRFRIGDRVLSSFKNAYKDIMEETKMGPGGLVSPAEVTLPDDILGIPLRPWLQGLSIQFPFDSVKAAGGLTSKIINDPYRQEVGNDNYVQEVGNRAPATPDNPYGRFGRPVREERIEKEQHDDVVYFMNGLVRYMTSQTEDDTGRGNRSFLPPSISEEVMIRAIPGSLNTGSTAEFFIGLGYEPDPDNPGFWRKTKGGEAGEATSGTYQYNYGGGGGYRRGGGGFGGSYRSASYAGLINWRVGV
jgi:hypothetical protein